MSDKPAARYDADWQEKYKSMISTAEAGGRDDPARPAGLHRHRLRRSLCSSCGPCVARHAELADTEIIHLLTLGDAPYAYKELADHFRSTRFFVAANVRDIIQEGYGDYTPIFLSDIPRLFSSGQMPLDVALDPGDPA